jgi:hypothetical protein
MATPTRDVAIAFIVLLMVLAIYVLRLNDAAGLMVDDAWYLLLAKSLADGTGYRLISSPLEAILPLYPPGLPALLSLIFQVRPDFPANVWLLKSISIASMMGAGFLTYVYLRRHRQLSREMAGLLAVATVLVPAFVFLATSTLMTECVFTLAQLGAVVLVHRSVDAPDRRHALLLVAAAAIIAAAVVLVRSAGAALILAAVLWLLKERLWQRAFIFAAVSVLCLMPWLTYATLNAPSAEQRAAHGGAVVYSYGDQLWMRWAGSPALGRITVGDIPARIAVNLTDISARSMGGIFLPTFLRGANESGEEVVSLGGIAGLQPGSMGIATATMAVSLLLSALVLAGFVDTVRRRATLAEFLVPISLAIVLLWPFWSFRFVLPLTPYLFFYLLAGVQLLTRSPRLARMALLCIIGLNLFDHAGYILQARQGSDSEWVRDSRDVDEALNWIAGNLGHDGAIASTNPALLYLRTGRQSIAFDDPGVQPNTWRSRGFRYLICLVPTQLPPGGPDEFKIVYRSPAQLWVIDLN